MGNAVVDNRGGNPLKRFKSDLSWIVHPDLSRTLQDLLEGKAVTDDEDGITITKTAGGWSELSELVIRHNPTAERVRIVIRPVRGAELQVLDLTERKLDRRGLVTQTSDAWLKTLQPDTPNETTMWELFNCVVIDIDPLGT